LAGIGDLACTVLAAEQDLRLRAGQAGMAWDQVDRLLRLRHVAWQLTREPHVAISTLSDFAAAAVTFHSHALMHLRSEKPWWSGHDLVRDPVEGWLLEARAAWSLVHLQSREMRTAALLFARCHWWSFEHASTGPRLLIIWGSGTSSAGVGDRVSPPSHCAGPGHDLVARCEPGSAVV
jgi:hypothetical protein